MTTTRKKPTPEPFTSRVIEIRALLNSRAGNPRYAVKFENGRVAETATDHSVGWDVENALSDGIPRRVEFTPAGRIAHWDEVPA